MREHKPVQKYTEEHAVFLDEEDFAAGNAGYTSKTLFYFEKNICIKITHQGEQMMENFLFTQNQVSGMVSAANRTSGGNNSVMDNSYMGN